MNSITFEVLNDDSLKNTPLVKEDANDGVVTMLSKKQQEGCDYYFKHIKLIHTKYRGMWVGILDDIIYGEFDYFNLHKKLNDKKLVGVFIIQVGGRERFLELKFNSNDNHIIQIMQNCEIRDDNGIIWFESV